MLVGMRQILYERRPFRLVINDEAKVIKEVEDESELLPPCEVPERSETDSEPDQIELETE